MAIPKQVPLFPLQRRVLFPGIPFHCGVAHPVHQDMVLDSIRGRKMLAVQPVANVAEEPQGVVCLARIRRVHCLPDGGLFLDLLGIALARVMAQVPRGKPYRCVQVEAFGGPGEESAPPPGWLQEAYQTIGSLRGRTGLDTDPFPDGLWVDMLCHFLPLAYAAKMQLLQECCHTRRCQMLAGYESLWRHRGWMAQFLPRLYGRN